jgi:hypothetical protein
MPMPSFGNGPLQWITPHWRPAVKFHPFPLIGTVAVLKCFHTPALVIVLMTLPVAAQQAVVDATPGPCDEFFPPIALARSRYRPRSIEFGCDTVGPTDVRAMLTAGWGPISYRLNTELSIQAWHWNLAEQWSETSGRGYFVGDAQSPGQTKRSFGYNLPHRGTTSNYGTSGGYSMLDDGNYRRTRKAIRIWTRSIQAKTIRCTQDGSSWIWAVRSWIWHGIELCPLPSRRRIVLR